ncbi:MAG TPA: zinc ribbon domain-containing protein [Thermoplasmata archaeon]|nr:zinc ribbon domain-containing protein [Thermoplasmata archaeon]
MAAPSATATCPKCGAPVSAGARFCKQCGAPLTAPVAPPAPAPMAATMASPAPASAPPAASAPPVDLRQRVDDDRGFLKRLQLLVPGYRGYREGEDIRAADSLLRIQVADKIKNGRMTVENTRQALVQANQFTALNDLAPLISDLWRLEGEIRFAEQGYTGISPAVRINPQQLDRLYEYDFGFAQAGDQLAQTIASLPSIAGGPAAAQAGTVIATARSQVNQLDQAFKARIQAIEGIRVS